LPEQVKPLVQLGHVTGEPQLSVVMPHAMVPVQGSFGVQPQPLGPASPPLHVFGALQLSVQGTITPQLLGAEPHDTLLQAVPLSVQPQALAPAPPPPHVLGGVHMFGHMMPCPQLFVAGPQAKDLQALVLSGVQHVLLDVHTPAFGHVAEHGTI
jgi:hypothetical protein